MIKKRIEKLTEEEFFAVCQQIHGYFNEYHCGGELNKVHFKKDYIPFTQHRVWTEDEIPIGCFQSRSMDIFQRETIIIDFEFIDDFLTHHKSIEDQLFSLGRLILHEIVHQFCYENGSKIDDDPHGKTFIQAAIALGLDFEDDEDTSGHFASDSALKFGLWIYNCLSISKKAVKTHRQLSSSEEFERLGYSSIDDVISAVNRGRQ